MGEHKVGFSIIEGGGEENKQYRRRVSGGLA